VPHLSNGTGKVSLTIYNYLRKPAALYVQKENRYRLGEKIQDQNQKTDIIYPHQFTLEVIRKSRLGNSWVKGTKSCALEMENVVLVTT